VFPPPPAWSSRIRTTFVTGTNGKTTTTTLIAAALGAGTSPPVLRVTTVGTFLGDARLEPALTHDGFVEAMHRALVAGGRCAAVEVTSEALGLGFAKAWPIATAVFTNLARDHLDARGSPEHYLASKAQLFVHLEAGGAAILNAWDPASALLAEIVPPGRRIVWVGAPSRAPGPPVHPPDLAADAVSVGWEGTRATLVFPASPGRLEGLPEEISVRGIGEVYVEAALAALAAAIEAGIHPRDAARAIAEAPLPPGRFQVLAPPEVRGPRVVVDFAHSPDALTRTLATARSLAKARVVVVFGAGGERDRGKRPLLGAAARGADRVVITSDNPRREEPGAIAAEIRAGLEGHADVCVELDRAEAIVAAIRGAGEGDVVVIAGRGPETHQSFAGRTIRLVDAEVAAEALGIRSPDRA